MAICFHTDEFLYTFGSGPRLNGLGISESTGVQEAPQGVLGLSVNRERRRAASSFNLGRQELFNPSASYFLSPTLPVKWVQYTNPQGLGGLVTTYFEGPAQCLTHRQTVIIRSVQSPVRRDATQWHSSGQKVTSGAPKSAKGISQQESGSDSECLVSTGDLQHDCPRPGMDQRPLEGWCPGTEHEPLFLEVG